MYEFMNNNLFRLLTARRPQELSISITPIPLHRPFGPPMIFDESTLPNGRKSSASCFAVVIAFKLPIRISIRESLNYGNLYVQADSRGGQADETYKEAMDVIAVR